MFTAMRRFRSLAALTAACVVALAASSAASANSVVGTYNPDVTVTASLVSITGNPDTVAKGSWIFASLSVTNNTAEKAWFRVEILASWPTGGLPSGTGGLVEFEPGKRYRIAFPVYVPRWAPSGVYTLGIRAFGEGVLDPSEAIASITVV